MRSRDWILVLAAALCLTPRAEAQVSTATLNVVVTDESKGVLPGVTVTATNLQTGRQHVGVTDERGTYQLVSLPPGTYKFQAEIAGFSTVQIPRIELLVGQNATIGVPMKIASLLESVTVTGEAPLVNVTSSQVAGNVDRRQMEELPLQGRNWLELSMMVRGMTANNITNTPGVPDTQFQLNLDGQQITQRLASSGGGQPKFSREAIAEFQIVTNLFDITQGRSTGVQVQAISRSGTNNLQGSVYGYFRDDRFNAKDFVSQTVLPFENQQVGGSVGGPIRRDRMHYFVSYEYERAPSSVFVTMPQLHTQNFTFENNVVQNSLMGRVDYSLSAKDHLSFRGSYWGFDSPFSLGSTAHPSAATNRTQDATNVLGSWSRVINQNMVQEVKIGYNGFNFANLLAVPEMASTPNYVFSGLTIGALRTNPQQFHQNLFSARYDLTWHRNTHDLKLGGEFLGWKDTGEWTLLQRGEYIFNSNPPDLDRRFPQSAWNNPAAWDVTGLDARVQRFDQNFGDWTIDIPRPTWAIWFGDNWRITNNLTVNYGARWDVDWGAMAPPGVSTTITWDPVGGVNPPFRAGEEIVLQPGDKLFDPNIRDLNNVALRAGFNYNVGGNNDLVIRGGTGHYYGIPTSNTTFSQQSFNGERILVNSFVNDGQPGFIQDPRRGLVNEDFVSGRAPVPPQAPRVIAHDYRMPYTWQASIGFQKQLSPVMGVEADLTFLRSYNLERGRDINLFFDPATGYNKDITTFGRPDPKFTQVQWIESHGRGKNIDLSSGFTRRFRDNFQGGITYTYTFIDQQIGDRFAIGANNQFDLEAEWGPSHPQRHTLRANALYHLPWGFNVSAVYFYGSREYINTTVSGLPFGKPGTNLLNIGAPITVRPVPEQGGGQYIGPPVVGTLGEACRACFIPAQLHKVDMRISKEFSLGDVKINGVAEVFNLFNHENFADYNTQVNSASFGRPTQSTGNAYGPRSGQFGFRLSF